MFNGETMLEATCNHEINPSLTLHHCLSVLETSRVQLEGVVVSCSSP